MPADHSLLETQRRFLSALREPIFDDSRARSCLPKRDGTVSPAFTATASALIAPSPTLAPTQRLELYHRQYWYRLLDSLAEDFPTLRRLLGEDVFWRLLESYVEATPPSTFTLRHFGAQLADFIRTHAQPPRLSVQAEELARLEYAVCASLEAPEKLPLETNRIGSSRLALQPHIQLFALRTAVDALWRGGVAIGSLRKASPTEPQRFFAIVFRDRFHLRIERVPRLAFAILSAIEKKVSLDEAMASVAATPGLFRRRDADRVRRWFSSWVARGWFFSAEHAQFTERKPS